MPLGVKEIESIIPHRSPFLLIDQILEVEAGKGAVGLKYVSIDEPYFQGHFPGFPIMPGVLIVEALAQVGSVALLSTPDNRGKMGFFAGINSFRFRKPVKPGDVLKLEVTLLRSNRHLGKGRARASVKNETVAEGELTFAIIEPDHDQQTPKMD